MRVNDKIINPRSRFILFTSVTDFTLDNIFNVCRLNVNIFILINLKSDKNLNIIIGRRCNYNITINYCRIFKSIRVSLKCDNLTITVCNYNYY